MAVTDKAVLNSTETDDKNGKPTNDLSDEEILANIEDSNPKTWINEDLWRTFALMMAFYAIGAIFKAGIVDPATGSFNFSWALFWIALDTTMLPLFGAAIRNQVMKGMSRKLEDQNRAFSSQKKDLLDENKKLIDEVKTLKDMSEKTKDELYKVRADLNAKCETLQAIKDGVLVANGKLAEAKPK